MEREEIVYTPTTTHPLKLEMERKSPNHFLYFSATIACVISFLSGVAFAWASPVLPKLADENNPLGRKTTPIEESWIVGILSVGALFGVVVSGHMADRIGRKKTILALAVPTAASLITLAFATSVPVFYAARFLQGLGAGSGFTILPVYLTEIAEDHNRGTLGCIGSVFIGLGLLFVYSVGPFLTVRDFCLACAAPLAVFFPCFWLWAPETPQYLALIGDGAALEASLSKLRSKSAVEVRREAADMAKKAEESEKGSIGDVFRTRSSRKALSITVCLVTFQQFAGINVVNSYMQTIFDATGSGLAPEASAIVVGAVQVFVIALSSAVVDKLGRRMLLIGSAVGSGLALLLLGLYFRVGDASALFWLPVSSLVLFIVSFNMGLATVPWVAMAEMFPASVKGAGVTVTGVVCFVDCFLITFFFPTLSQALGMAMSFWIFAVCCAVAAAFVYAVLPETKGRSIGEIQALLDGSRKSATSV